MHEKDIPPDHLRCKRTDGRQWRCKKRVMEGLKLCEIHHLQGRHRQYKQKVPESLKIQRKYKKKTKATVNGEAVLENLGIRARRLKLGKPVKRRGVIIKSEAEDDVVRKIKGKRKDRELELIRMVLKREVEKRKKKTLNLERNDSDNQNDSNSEGETTRDLPNGLMAITSCSSGSGGSNSGNVGSPCDVKIGAESKPVLRRCFRSKNIEPVPIGALQMLPFKGKVVSLKKRRKRCHWCRRNGGLRGLIQCSACQKQFYCMDCVKDRYYAVPEEIKISCPVCRRTCTCRACLVNQCIDIDSKELTRDKNKVDQVLHFHYLICMLLPVLKQINQDQSIELEIEAQIKGQKPSEVQIKQDEFSCNKPPCCNNCKSSIVNFHRSCLNCSYKLCLSCSREVFQRSLSGCVQALICKCPNGKKACMFRKPLLDEKSDSPSSHDSYGSARLYSSSILHSWKVYDSSNGIPCPPSKFGGCGDDFLNLRCVFPASWTKDLEVSAEEIVGCYELPETADMFSQCSLCLGMNHESNGIKQLQEAAGRAISNDNFLYCPSVVEIRGDNLEHFQKHWSKGHPVVVHNVLQGMSDLSWDPIFMFCTYLKNCDAKSQHNGAMDCLNWFEVEIGIRQLFKGSLNGRTHTNMCHEMLKLKGWLSASLFQEHFPAHYAEILHTLPLPEYMDPTSGILNVAAKLPQETSQPDLGPCIYISCSSGENHVQADSVTELCNDSCDTVHILMHTTDDAISPDQIDNIRKLMKKHVAQEQRESSGMTPEGKTKDKAIADTSLSGENLDVGLHNVVGEESQLNRRDARASWFPAAPNGTLHSSLKDRHVLHDEENITDTQSDTDPIKRSHGITRNSQSSKDVNLCGTHTAIANFIINETRGESCGAQWDVFRRQDVPKLLEYLRRHSDEFTHTNGFREQLVCSILDQNFFLDATHKMRLKQEFEIEPWTFKQHVGEAVVIPAGCPYQIRKLKSCVNVVLEFISPENATECIQMIDELHLLPKNHKTKVDKLEARKMAIYGIGAAIKEIRKLTGCGDQC
ncbi:lysine-specific demethylase JMJ25 isoform X1 [Tripterygium wilfordii]|uniref:Lysine-specific demethylase JMJ25 isoform X1 n=1 Tax=Tripterygium wilfordii TaxID=458696 RepID=A0A7J7D775_TRIWF|nr:lysine-specific demethylase JMJ25 [Tripterygium wilfordii]KAF5742225.1 lysine-specific demethylase JMJ25 isoform X1 [Tripterygium wilfordii]